MELICLIQYSMHTTNVCERKQKFVNQVRRETLIHLHLFCEDIWLCLCTSTCLPWSSLSPESSAGLQRLQQAIHDTSFIILCKHNSKTSATHQQALD